MVGLATFSLGRAQWTLARQNYRREVYQRRIDVFRAIAAFIAGVNLSESITLEQCHQLLRDAAECEFLFPSKVRAFVDELHKQGLELWGCCTNLSSGLPTSPQEYRQQLVSDKLRLLDGFKVHAATSLELFRPTLYIGD